MKHGERIPRQAPAKKQKSEAWKKKKNARKNPHTGLEYSRMAQVMSKNHRLTVGICEANAARDAAKEKARDQGLQWLHHKKKNEAKMEKAERKLDLATTTLQRERELRRDTYTRMQAVYRSSAEEHMVSSHIVGQMDHMRDVAAKTAMAFTAVTTASDEDRAPALAAAQKGVKELTELADKDRQLLHPVNEHGRWKLFGKKTKRD